MTTAPNPTHRVRRTAASERMFADGSVLLRSYQTPVAFWHNPSRTLYMVNRKYSVTTTKHVNEFGRRLGDIWGWTRTQVPVSPEAIRAYEHYTPQEAPTPS